MPTIKDVAQEAGVSKTAASLVLRGQWAGRISSANARNVRNVAKRLGYPEHKRAKSKLDHGGLPARFWERTRIEDRGHHTPCVIWTGAIHNKGYGTFKTGDATAYVHRVAYETLIGPIPSGLVLDHLCQVRNCVAVDHLEPVTNLVNVRRGIHVARTHCPQGHPYDEANTYYEPYRWGVTRKCRACHRERQRVRWARMREDRKRQER